VRLDTAAGPLSLGQKGPGTWVGEMAMIAPALASASVVAKEASQVRPVPHSTYLDLLETQPQALGQALYRIAADLARRLRRSTEVEAQPGQDLRVSQIITLEGLDRPAQAASATPKKAAAKQMPRVDEAALVRTLERLGLFTPSEPQEKSRSAALKKALTALVASGLSVQTYLHDEPILEAGERADGAFILLGGSARVTAGTPGTPLALDAELVPGTLFGHQAFFDDHVRQATVQSVGASVVAVLWPGAVDELLRQAQSGTPLWLPLLDWFACRLTEDARALNRRLHAAIAPAKAAAKR
jgi:CRP-like cAMP-binding protein